MWKLNFLLIGLFLAPLAHAVSLTGACDGEISGEAITLTVQEGRPWHAAGKFDSGQVVELVADTTKTDTFIFKTYDTNPKDKWIGSGLEFSIDAREQDSVEVYNRFFAFNRERGDTGTGQYLRCHLVLKTKD